MQRAALERARTLRAWRQARAHRSGPPLPSSWAMQPGRYRKRRLPGRNGSPWHGCVLCAGHKRNGSKRLDERRSDLLYRLMLEELGLDSRVRWRCSRSLPKEPSEPAWARLAPNDRASEKANPP